MNAAYLAVPTMVDFGSHRYDQFSCSEDVTVTYELK